MPTCPMHPWRMRLQLCSGGNHGAQGHLHCIVLLPSGAGASVSMGRASVHYPGFLGGHPGTWLDGQQFGVHTGLNNTSGYRVCSSSRHAAPKAYQPARPTFFKLLMSAPAAHLPASEGVPRNSKSSINMFGSYSAGTRCLQGAYTPCDVKLGSKMILSSMLGLAASQLIQRVSGVTFASELFKLQRRCSNYLGPRADPAAWVVGLDAFKPPTDDLRVRAYGKLYIL